MKHQQPNAFAAGLRAALDFATERRDNQLRMLKLNTETDLWGAGGLYQLNQLIDTLHDQLLDAGGFLGDAPEPTEDRVTVRGWTVCLPDTDSYTEQTGWFEYDKDGTGGGLWFEDATLVDYDGVSCIPAAVVEGIRQLGFIVPADME